MVKSLIELHSGVLQKNEFYLKCKMIRGEVTECHGLLTLVATWPPVDLFVLLFAYCVYLLFSIRRIALYKV